MVNMGTNSRVAAFNLGLKGSLMLYVLGSVLFTMSFAIAAAVILTQVARYRHLAITALRSLSMDGLPVRKAPREILTGDVKIERFHLQPARLSWRPQASA